MSMKCAESIPQIAADVPQIGAPPPPHTHTHLMRLIVEAHLGKEALTWLCVGGGSRGHWDLHEVGLDPYHRPWWKKWVGQQLHAKTSSIYRMFAPFSLAGLRQIHLTQWEQWLNRLVSLLHKLSFQKTTSASLVVILHFIHISAFCSADKGNFATVLQLCAAQIQNTSRFDRNRISLHLLKTACDGWKTYFSWMKSSVSCVALMCMRSLVKSLALLLLPGSCTHCCWGRKKKPWGAGGRGVEERVHDIISPRPFKELSSGGLRSAGPLSHQSFPASSPRPLGAWSTDRLSTDLWKHRETQYGCNTL